MQKIPIHEEQCVKILDTMLTKFYDKCLGKYRNSVHSDGTNVNDAGVLSATWVANERIVGSMRKSTYLLDADEFDSGMNDQLSKQETKIFIELSQQRSFHRSELIFDSRKIDFLANLRTSLSWFEEQLSRLIAPGSSENTCILIKSPSEIMLDNTDTSTSAAHYTNANESSDAYLKQAVCIKLSHSSEKRVRTVVQEIHTLAETCLFVLRIELRAHCLYFIDFSVREGSYHLTQVADEPDPYVIALNQDLVKAEASITASLSVSEKMFVFDGLAILIGEFMIFLAKYIKQFNALGLDKMTKCILALQQNLSNITLLYESRIEKAKKYFNLYSLSGPELLTEVEENGARYSLESYEVMIKFMYPMGVLYADHVDRKTLDNALASLKKICPK